MIVLDVLGDPRPQARPRVFNVAGHARAVSPKTRWHDLVYLMALEARVSHGELPEGPVRVEMAFRFARPQSYPKRSERPHLGRPDADNLAKSTMDSLCPVLLPRDEWVTELYVTKRYALAGEAPGCRIELAAVGGD